MAILCLTGFFACSDNDNEFATVSEKNTQIEPGLYRTEILMYAEKDGQTRGLDTINGHFTNVYPYDTIYIHPADNDRNDVLAVPLKEVDYCQDSCRAVQMDIEVLDDGGYIIWNNERTASITIAEGDSVYFSSIRTPYWNATMSEEKTPLTGQDIFVDDRAVNNELLRSSSLYGLDELFDMSQANVYENPYEIIMSRHCTGFRVYFMFTDVPRDGRPSYTFYKEDWIYEFGTAPENFYIKLYFGPNFCHKYDLLHNETVDVDTEGGYYASNNERYVPFRSMAYVYSTGSGSHTGGSYEGLGYVTADGHYLLAPLNANIPESQFGFYAFIKYSIDPADATNEEFLTSDEGAKWFYVNIPDVTLTLNRIHFVAMAFDYHELMKQFPQSVVSTQSSAATSSTLTRGWFENRAPQEIDIKPAMVKVITE